MFVLIFLVLAIYLKFLFPTFALGDGGLFSAAAVELGVVLPPGYPLYVLLGKISHLLFPLSSPAWRLNFLTAMLTILAIVFTVLSLRKMGVRKAFSLVAGLFLGLAPAVLRNSLSAEVYSLNLFFLSLIFYLALQRRWLLMVFIFGLSLTNHYIMFLFLPAFCLYWIMSGSVKWSGAIVCLTLFVLGWMGYVYLPLRASASPSVNWGKPANWFYFRKHVKRSHFQVLEFAGKVKTREKMRFSGYFFVEGFVRQLPWGLGALAFCGLLWGVFFKKQLEFFLLLYVYLVTGLGLIWGLNFSFTEVNRYRFVPYLLPSWWALSIGLAWLLKLFWQYCKHPRERFSFRLLVGLLVISPVLLALRADSFSRSSYFAYDMGANVLRTLQPQAVLFNQGSNQAFSLYYLTVVERRRPDVQIFDRGGVVFGGLVDAPLFQISDAEWEKRRNAKETEIIMQKQSPVFYTRATRTASIKPWQLIPLGVTHRVTFWEDTLQPLPAYVLRDRHIDTDDFWLNYERSNFNLEFAKALRQKGRNAEARSALRQAIQLDPTGRLAKAIKDLKNKRN